MEQLPFDFIARLSDLEKAYLRESDPIRQSGFGGGPERWRNERELILDAVNEDGDFLDVGCSNGYLLECLVSWAAECKIRLTPFGVDSGASLIELARHRLPRYADNFWVANAWDWNPPRRFRYVYSLHDCVPEAHLTKFICRLGSHFVEAGGTLIIGAYGSNSKQQPARDVAADIEAAGYRVSGSSFRGTLPTSRIAWTIDDGD